MREITRVYRVQLYLNWKKREYKLRSKGLFSLAIIRVSSLYKYISYLSISYSIYSPAFRRITILFTDSNILYILQHIDFCSTSVEITSVFMRLAIFPSFISLKENNCVPEGTTRSYIYILMKHPAISVYIYTLLPHAISPRYTPI